jgi:hypothetical protein
MTNRSSSSILAAALLGLHACFFAEPCLAQDQEKGDATLRVEYQYIDSGKFYDDVAKYDYWSTQTHIVLLSGDYALSDRWTVYAALPYVQKRFSSEVDWGGDPHNPNDAFWVDFVPPDKRFHDDGNYHGGFQDLSFGVRYLALEGPLTVSPFIGFGFPTTDYPIYAKAAIGKNLWHIPVGVSLSYIPYFSDCHFRGNLAYVFSEEPLNINVDYLVGYLSAGYWFTPRLSMDLFLSAKWTLDGLLMPWDFTDDPYYSDYPDGFDTVEWWQHDRLLRNRSVDLGIALDYFLNEQYKLSGSLLTGIWADQSNQIDLAVTLALTRYFGGD